MDAIRGASVKLLPTHLPFLESFSGTSAFAQWLIPNRPVRRATIIWPQFPYSAPNDEVTDSWDSDTVIDSLVKSTHPGGIASLSNSFYCWPPIRIIGALGVSLNLHILYIVCQNSDPSGYEKVR
jgi:hypothetical protein